MTELPGSEDVKHIVPTTINTAYDSVKHETGDDSQYEKAI